MKKLFAVFCAFALAPLFSASAWIGGPFGNNTYFGENGDDGVYEAVASARNGLGIFRIVVGNNFNGVNPDAVVASLPQQQPRPPGSSGVFLVNGIASGNVVIGGLRSSSSNIWYFQGTTYFGTTLGTVNSVQGKVTAVANATVNGGTATANSFFRARLLRTGRSLPAKAFTGAGKVTVTGLPAPVRFTVFGNKVSDDILFGL